MFLSRRRRASSPSPRTPRRPVPAPVDGDPVTVEVVGSIPTAQRLREAVPPGWWVTATEAPSRHPCVDLVVLVDPDPAVVADLTRADPEVDCVVLLPDVAGPAEVVAVLDAGAAACLRADSVDLLVGQLAATRRRIGRDHTPRP